MDLLARHVVVQSGEHGARVRFSCLAVDIFELGDAAGKLLSDGCISRPTRRRSARLIILRELSRHVPELPGATACASAANTARTLS